VYNPKTQQWDSIKKWKNTTVLFQTVPTHG
jgi:hypothetical protein